MRVAIALLLLGCGAAAADVSPEPDACDRARGDAAAAWSALASQLTPGAAERVSTPIDGATAALAAHVAAVNENPPEQIDAPSAMRLSGVVMDAIDALPGDVPEPLRARADRAAEDLLTDRTPGGSVRAARAAVDALEEALGAADPDRARAREAASAVERLRRRAETATEGYTQGPRAGDRGAARAERLEVTLSESRRAARGAAVEASSQVRAACGFSRALAVPSP